MSTPTAWKSLQLACTFFFFLILCTFVGSSFAIRPGNTIDDIGKNEVSIFSTTSEFYNSLVKGALIPPSGPSQRTSDNMPPPPRMDSFRLLRRTSDNMYTPTTSPLDWFRMLCRKISNPLRNAVCSMIYYWYICRMPSMHAFMVEFFCYTIWLLWYKIKLINSFFYVLTDFLFLVDVFFFLFFWKN